MTYQLIISGGTVVTAGSIALLDVAVSDGRIVAIGAPGSFAEADAERTIDASGRLVLPGGVDAHVHFDTALTEAMSSQSIEAGAIAAAHGGTTTVIDFSHQSGDESLLASIADKKAVIARQPVAVDYALHAMLTGEFPLEVTAEIPAAVEAGVVSFKTFTTFSGDSASGTMHTDDGRILSVLEAARDAGGITMVHCEDDCVIDLNVRRLYAEGRQHARHVHLARPNLAEEAAIKRILLLAERSASPLYIVHVSTHEGVAAIDEARGRHQPVAGEVLHNQLVFTSEQYDQPEPQRFHNYPPMKSEADRLALWQGLRDGALRTIASDDFTIPLAAKLSGAEVDNVTGGHNGIETRMAVAFTEGVLSGAISLREFVETTATNPAKLFGLYPRKGVIEVGSDADFVVIDPGRRTTVAFEDLHSDCDYSNWVGWELAGFPLTTVLRGVPLVEDGRWTGPRDAGRFVPGGRPEVD